MVVQPLVLIFIALASWLVTGVIYYFSRSGWLMDTPNQRSAHKQPTARGGGLAIVICFYEAMIATSDAGASNNALLLALMAGLLVAAIGFWDDHRHIPAKWRMLIHLLASTWAVYCLGYQGLESILAVFLLVWCLNLFNFMDGIDGIAGGEAIFVTLALSWAGLTFDPQVGQFAQLLAFATLGFLIWNFPPAKIFMGDVGSGFLGFALGVLILHNGLFSPEFYIAMILFGVFVVDASLTLLIRMFRGERWYQAHSCHAYQHRARKVGHLATTVTVMAINLLWLLPIALLVRGNPDWALVLALVAYLPLFVLAWRCGAGYD